MNLSDGEPFRKSSQPAANILGSARVLKLAQDSLGNQDAFIESEQTAIAFDLDEVTKRRVIGDDGGHD